MKPTLTVLFSTLPISLFLSSCLFDKGPTPILFMGNSITWHDTLASVGWNHRFGMAASSEDKDYVHQTISLLAAKGIHGQAFVGSLDCAFCDGPIDAHTYNAAREVSGYKPHWVVLQLGENSTDVEVIAGKLTAQYHRLLQALTNAGARNIICMSMWGDTTLQSPRNFAVQEAIRDFPGVLFVDITDVTRDPSNYGDSTLYSNPAVLWHPGDAGMHALAEHLVAHLVP